MTPFAPLQPRRPLLVQDVPHPNLIREVFPYSAVPRSEFERDETPTTPAPAIWITDTTFRDGQQAREPYTVEQIVHIYDLLHRLDGETGLIRQCEFFLYTEKDRAALEAVKARGYRFPEVTSWIRAVKSDFQLVKAAGVKETGILTSCSDYHIFNKLNMTRSQALSFYLEIVDAALGAGITPRCHFEDLTRADVYGFALPFAQALMERGRLAGVPLKIRLCDTMGVGLPWPTAALPRGIPKLVRAFVDEAGVPSEQLEWQGAAAGEGAGRLAWSSLNSMVPHGY